MAAGSSVEIHRLVPFRAWEGGTPPPLGVPRGPVATALVCPETTLVALPSRLLVALRASSEEACRGHSTFHE